MNSLTKRPPVDLDDMGPSARFHAFCLLASRPGGVTYARLNATFGVTPRTVRRYIEKAGALYFVWRPLVPDDRRVYLRPRFDLETL